MMRAHVIALLVLAGCGASVERDNQTVARRIEEARARGAYACAPRELATAEAKLAFSAMELRAGEFKTAREEGERALLSAKLAIGKSDPARCRPDQDRPLLDTDGDGLMDADDRCPSEREDRDGFADDDGCPDLDNDQDGVLDTADRCPLDPEDRDGFSDDDGCPDPDNDGDEIRDADDACPNQAGLLAQRGCPEPDTDGDGTPDETDACRLLRGDLVLKGCPKNKLIHGVGDLLVVPKRSARGVVEELVRIFDAQKDLKAAVRARHEVEARALCDALVARGIEASRLLVQKSARALAKGRVEFLLSSQ